MKELGGGDHPTHRQGWLDLYCGSGKPCWDIDKVAKLPRLLKSWMEKFLHHRSWSRRLRWKKEQSSPEATGHRPETGTLQTQLCHLLTLPQGANHPASPTPFSLRENLMGCSEDVADVVTAPLKHIKVVSAVVGWPGPHSQLLALSLPTPGSQIGCRGWVPSCTERLGSQPGGI